MGSAVLVDETVTARLAAENRRRMGAQVLHYALKPFGNLEFSEIYRLELDSLPPARPLEGYEIGPATDHDIDEIVRELVRDEPGYVIRNLWSQGHHCFVARSDGRIVAYDWIGFSKLQEEEFAITLEPEHAFCLNAYTHPDHRGRGIHYELLRNLLVFAAANGKTRVYTLVSLFNRDSWKSHIRMGWRRDFTYCYFRPYFTPGRIPWPFNAPRYPARLNWQRHSWLFPQSEADVR